MATRKSLKRRMRTDYSIKKFIRFKQSRIAFIRIRLQSRKVYQTYPKKKDIYLRKPQCSTILHFQSKVVVVRRKCPSTSSKCVTCRHKICQMPLSVRWTNKANTSQNLMASLQAIRQWQVKIFKRRLKIARWLENILRAAYLNLRHVLFQSTKFNAKINALKICLRSLQFKFTVNRCWSMNLHANLFLSIHWNINENCRRMEMKKRSKRKRSIVKSKRLCILNLPII